MIKNLALATGILGLSYLLLGIDAGMGHWPSRTLGIHPGLPIGLLQIIPAPLFHENRAHFMSNALPWVMLTPIICLTERGGVFKAVTVAAWVGGGLMVWFLGPRGVSSFGLSFLTYGYMGFLVARVLAKRDILSLVIAGGVGYVFWQSLIHVLTPEMNGVPIAWMGHLGGLVCGIVAALVIPTTGPRAITTSAPRIATG